MTTPPNKPNVNLGSETNISESVCKDEINELLETTNNAKVSSQEPMKSPEEVVMEILENHIECDPTDIIPAFTKAIAERDAQWKALIRKDVKLPDARSTILNSMGDECTDTETSEAIGYNECRKDVKKLNGEGEVG